MTQTSSSPLVEEKVEDEAVIEASGLSPRLIFETIRRHGEEELKRPLNTLFWSGIAAGILISFSVLGEAYLRAYLPDADWRFIVENLGYSLGFLLVILGRMQLFTENTITTVVPAVIDPCRAVFVRVATLWSVVLFANIIGAFLIATFLVYTPVLTPDLLAIVTDLSKHATGFSPVEGLVRGIPAGILIAAIVWMLPSAQNNEVLLIIIFTWLIALGDFTHIIAGSVEMAVLAVQGMISAPQAVFRFFLPVLVGNVIGGTAVFTMMTYAQIRPEIDETE
ncbi:formate/nitrite transporter family protein [Tateyamaria omphalii]|uniref:Transporter (Formate/nitrite transporter family protein) n=1 Tax=Tateyamaria omphalii TaxID=299262 RepID=A0A1P8MSD5_9RHOB|nr:formate/nitrite transporter family protein [Tateyamaria omphalii]APX10903.1 transporter (formate/nitrite transporter family protein) [Tateyamaria omphalii]